jgi:hypothetical protein
MMKLMYFAAGIVVIAVAISVAPDVSRYLRIRAM